MEVLRMQQFFLILPFLAGLVGLAKAAMELAGAECALAKTRREDYADTRRARHLSQ